MWTIAYLALMLGRRALSHHARRRRDTMAGEARPVMPARSRVLLHVDLQEQAMLFPSVTLR